MSRATEITTSRRGDVTNARDKQTVLCPLLISNYWTGGCSRTVAVSLMRLILLFVTILQKYTPTLRIVGTRRCCFYHESKMVMTPQRLLCTLKGSGSGEESNSLIVSIKYTMLLRRLDIRHMRNKWRVVNIYIVAPVRQFYFLQDSLQRLAVLYKWSQSLDVTSPASFILA